MNFHTPYKVYTAASNLEAHAIVQLLQAQGIEAFAVEDQSPVGYWWLGTVSQIHLPDVWVDKADSQRAAEVIVSFEETRKQRQQSNTMSQSIDATCEMCGRTTEFPADLDDTTQECPHCRGYVDVGGAHWIEDAAAE